MHQKWSLAGRVSVKISVMELVMSHFDQVVGRLVVDQILACICSDTGALNENSKLNVH